MKKIRRRPVDFTTLSLQNMSPNGGNDNDHDSNDADVEGGHSNADGSLGDEKAESFRAMNWADKESMIILLFLYTLQGIPVRKYLRSFLPANQPY